MNWDAVAAISEGLGSVAVLVTVGYLAVQVRHARSEARRALSQGRGEALRTVIAQHLDPRINHLTLAANAALGAPAIPFVEAVREQTGMSEEDATTLLWIQILWWNHFLQIIPKVDELAEVEQAQFEVPIRYQYGDRGVGRLFFETYIKRMGHPDAVRFIERVLARAP